MSKIIHQTWKTVEIPEQYKTYQESWKIWHPHFTYMFWTDALIEEFVMENYPEYYKTFTGFRYPIQRVDMVRYMILDYFGGLYVDLDFECKKSFEHYFDNNDDLVVLGQEPLVQARTVYQKPRVFSNALMLSKHPGHKLWKYVLESCQNRAQSFKYKHNVLYSTGPGLLTDVLEALLQKSKDFNSSILWTEPDVFFSKVAPGHLQHRIKSPEKIEAIHHWSNSWITPNKVSSSK